MRERRLRATLLLKTVVLVGCVAVLVGVCALSLAGPLPLSAAVWVLVALAGILVVGIETGLVPWIVERWLAGRVGKRQGRPPSLWFVDHDLEEGKKAAARRDEVRDNPSLW